jgi:hypothetical protein
VAAGVRLVRVLGPQELLDGDGLRVIHEEPTVGEVARCERLVEAAAVGQRADASLLVHEIEPAELEARITVRGDLRDRGLLDQRDDVRCPAYDPGADVVEVVEEVRLEILVDVVLPVSASNSWNRFGQRMPSSDTTSRRCVRRDWAINAGQSSVGTSPVRRRTPRAGRRVPGLKGSTAV